MFKRWYKHHSVQLLAAVAAAVEVWANVPSVRQDLPPETVAVLAPIFAGLAFWLHFRDVRKEKLHAQDAQDASGRGSGGGRRDPERPVAGIEARGSARSVSDR